MTARRRSGARGAGHLVDEMPGPVFSVTPLGRCGVVRVREGGRLRERIPGGRPSAQNPVAAAVGTNEYPQIADLPHSVWTAWTDPGWEKSMPTHIPS